MTTAHVVNVWARPADCESSSCPAWQVDPDGTVRLRNTLRPDAVVEFTADEWAMLQRAAVNGEVTALP